MMIDLNGSTISFDRESTGSFLKQSVTISGLQLEMGLDEYVALITLLSMSNSSKVEALIDSEIGVVRFQGGEDE